MYFRSGSNSTGSFKFTCANTTVQAHLYWNSAQELGFLSNGGGWRLRSRLNNAYGPNLWFHNQSAWSGNVIMSEKLNIIPIVFILYLVRIQLI